MGTLPEWLTGSPAKRLCIARVSSNLTGVVFFISSLINRTTTAKARLMYFRQPLEAESGCSPPQIQTAWNVSGSSHLVLEFTVFDTFLPGFFAPHTPHTQTVSGERILCSLTFRYQARHNSSLMDKKRYELQG